MCLNKVDWNIITGFWNTLRILIEYPYSILYQICEYPSTRILAAALLGTDIFIKLEYIARSLVKIKSIPDWHLFISGMETKWTKWYTMTLNVIAYRSFELLFGTHTFHFNCFFEDFNCVFTQIRCLSRVLTLR